MDGSPNLAMQISTCVLADLLQSPKLGIANGGVPRRGFSNSWRCCFFFAWKSVIAREFLLKIDTSLAGLRTNLLFEKPPSENPPFDFPDKNPWIPEIRKKYEKKYKIAHPLGKSKWGLCKWGLKVLVHNCPQLPTIVVILRGRRKFPLERGPKGA